MDVEQLAQVEVTSEDSAAPIETVFHFGRGPGWRGPYLPKAYDFKEESCGQTTVQGWA